jgi:hypothetical protein
MSSTKGTKTRVAWLAASAALVFGAGGCASNGPEPAQEEATALVKCHGGNSCKGQSECHTAHSKCSGFNSCKGKGWVVMSPEACEEAGGTS